ncbi:MAG: N-acetyltransferase [Bacteroidota bacterium]|nr:N-acetyltransferase [Bacteroidota bacterium]
MAKKATSPKEYDIDVLQLTDEEEARQLVLRVGDHRVRMEYDRSGDRIFLTNLDVPRALVIDNMQNRMIEKVFNWVEANNLKIIPTNQVVKAYLRENKGWQRLLLKGVQV